MDAVSANDTTDQPALADIRKEWHWVRPGIEEILDSDPHVNEIPEDVYAACVNGRAALWTTDRYFVVTQTFNDNSVLGFSIWYAWSKDRGAKHSLVGHPFFERMAREMGCQFMQTQTSRGALVDHFLRDLDYEVKTTVLVKNL